MGSYNHKTIVAALIVMAASFTLAPAQADDAYNFHCYAGERLRVVVWNAQVEGFGECAGSLSTESVTCDATGSPQPYASCSGVSPGATLERTPGYCGYRGYGASYTFFVTCWTDQSTPFPSVPAPSTPAKHTNKFQCRAGEFIHVLVDGKAALAQGSCGLSTVSCDSSLSDREWPVCANTGAVPSAITGEGECSYWGDAGYYTFALVCWTDTDPTVGTLGIDTSAPTI